MKTLISIALLLIAALSASWADAPAIKVVGHSPRGESKDIVTVGANDDATREAILRFWQETKKAFPEDRRNLFGPDSGYIEIRITNGHEEIMVRSWHPLYEKNKKLIVTSSGIESLNGRDRKEVLDADQKWYREARKVFDEVLNFTKSRTQAKDDGQLTPAPDP